MKEEIEILFKEYDALRAEIVSGLSGRHTILSIGIAAIGLICTSAVAFSKSTPELTGLIFTFGVPAMGIFVLLIWFGEYTRVQNAGIHLYDLESKINTEAEKKLLTYETNRRDNLKKKKDYPDPTVALLFMLSLVSLLIGFVVLPACCIWRFLLVFMVGVVIFGIDWIINRKIRSLRKRP